MPTESSSWPRGATYALDGARVSISQPVLVGRRGDYLWFPHITQLSSGDLVVNEFGEHGGGSGKPRVTS